MKILIFLYLQTQELHHSLEVLEAPLLLVVQVAPVAQGIHQLQDFLQSLEVLVVPLHLEVQLLHHFQVAPVTLGIHHSQELHDLLEALAFLFFLRVLLEALEDLGVPEDTSSLLVSC